jgi:hypothetical protein
MRCATVRSLPFLVLVGMLSSNFVFGSVINDVLAATKEPERFAFIVGNARYQLAFSNLEDLPDACTEAINFRKELLALGWPEDHIYPLTKKAMAGETSDDGVIDAVCDLTNVQLANDLTAFMNLLLTNENNPYGVVYYAGHGAESNDELYAFGVDANVDLKREIDLLRLYPNYEIFSRPALPNMPGTTAVNLTRLISTINGPTGKALLMIVDACRSDPILDDFVAKRSDSAPSGADARKRLSVGYINARPDKYDAMYRNIMVMFAGRPGKPADSGTVAKPNWFSEHLFSYLHDQANQQASAPIFVTNFESEAKSAQGDLPDFDRQIPQHIGSMASKPVFCFKGCAQPLSIWTNEVIKIIADDIGSLDPTLGRATGSRGGFSIKRDSGGSLKARLLAASVDWTAGSEEQSASSPSKLLSDQTRPINLDVFYCSGDAAEAKRESTAREFAETIRRTENKDSILVGTFIDQIRLRSLDINVNLAMARPRSGTSLVLEQSDPASQAWAQRLKAGFDRVYMDNVTKGYIRAYFCEGFSAKQKPRPLVYAQVSHKDQIGPAKQFVSLLSAALPNLKFIDAIEPVDDTHPGSVHAPNSTQVRYYTPDQLGNADRIAGVLKKSLGKPVVVVRMHIAGSQVRTNPVIEVWFGRDEMASWAAPASRN